MQVVASREKLYPLLEGEPGILTKGEDGLNHTAMTSFK
jgi:hypothetical protein